MSASKLAALALFGGALASAGCGEPVISTLHTNRGIDTTVAAVRGNRLLAPGWSFLGPEIHLDVEKSRRRPTGELTFWLHLRYSACACSDYLDLQRTASLVLRVDGEEVPLSPKYPPYQYGGDLPFGGYFEENWFEVSPKLLRRIAFAARVEAIVKGKTQTIRRAFGEANASIYRRFVEEHAGADDSDR